MNSPLHGSCHSRAWGCANNALVSNARPRQILYSCARQNRKPWNMINPIQAIESSGDALATEFAKYINQARAPGLPTNRMPSPLMSPTATITAQLNALQLNDWPDTDAGVKTAFAFSKPKDVEKLLVVGAASSLVRSWFAKDEYVSHKEFSSMLHSPPFNVMLNCEQWKVISSVCFPSTRKPNCAVQAIEVTGKAAPSSELDERLRPYTFTFCLQSVDEGPYKGCWMTTGVRVGDYANV